MYKFSCPNPFNGYYRVLLAYSLRIQTKQTKIAFAKLAFHFVCNKLDRVILEIFSLNIVGHQYFKIVRNVSMPFITLHIRLCL